MDTFSEKRKRILDTLESKSLLKQKTYNTSLEVFHTIKDTLHEMSGEINDEITSSRLLRIEYRDRGKFEAQIQIAGDMLIFALHTNTFTFDEKDDIASNNYYNSKVENQYFGVINIYNFLADSFKYNKGEDEGYLVARIFINNQKEFFIEGIDTIYSIDNYGKYKIDDDTIVDIIESFILHTMNFDLYIPPFSSVGSVAVEQMNTKAEISNIKTGKRLGRI